MCSLGNQSVNVFLVQGGFSDFSVAQADFRNMLNSSLLIFHAKLN